MIDSALTIFRIAIRNLLQNRRRSLLLGAAIALVTGVLVLLTSISNGMQINMLEVGTTLASGHVNVAGFFKLTSGDQSPLVTEYPKLLELVRKEVKGVDSIAVRGRGFGKMISETASQMGVMVGIDISKEPRFHKAIQVLSGDLAGLARPDGVMLFAKQATRLEVKVGDRLSLSAPTARGARNTIDVQVVAIARDMGMMSSFSFFVSHSVLTRVYQLRSDTTGAIHIFLDDVERTDEVADHLRKVIEAAGYRVMDPTGMPFYQKFSSVAREDWTGQKIDVTTWNDELAFMRYTLQTFSVLTAIFIVVLLVMVGLGVMNTMWMAIRERTSEIGTLRAIGMKRRWVLGMFVCETFVLSLAATVVGCTVAWIAVIGLDAAQIGVTEGFEMFLMANTLKLVMDVKTAALSIVVIASATTMVSLFPSWKAARRPPITAIQHVQ